MKRISKCWRRMGERPVLLLSALILLLLLRLGIGVLSETGASKDALNNLELAHGLATTGRLVESGDDLSMYREPLPIALYALQMRLDPRLDGVEVADLAAGGPEVRALRQQHLMLAGLLLAAVAAQTWRIAPRRGRLVTSAAAVVAVHAMFIEVVGDLTLTELHAAVAVVASGLIAQRWVEQPRVRDAALLGLMIGLGALAKSSLLYVGGTFLFVLAVLMLLRDRTAACRVLATLGVAIVVVGIAVLPWMARNAATFATWSIADRGGLSLWYRAIYEQATPDELRGSWYEFTPLPLRPLAGAILDIEPEDLERPLRRVNRFHPDEEVEQRSFYELARVDRFEGTEAYLAAGVPTRAQARVLADQDLLSAGLQVLRRDPSLFATTTPMFLWRGTWVVKAAPLVPRPVLGLLNPAGMIVLLAVGLSALLGRRPPRFAVVGLPFGIVLFSALLTMHEPRFSEPALPTMLVLLAVGAARTILWALPRLRGRPWARA